MVGHSTSVRNLMNRRNIPATPKNDVNACEDFLTVVDIYYILAATLQVMELESKESSASIPSVPAELQHAAITDIANKVVKRMLTFIC